MGRKKQPGRHYITVEFNPQGTVSTSPPPWAAAWHEQIAKAAAATFGKPGKKKRTKKQREHVGGGLFTVSQLATKWAVSPDLIRKLFEDEPGVMRIGNPNPRRKRRYVTLRIPETVADRVLRRLSP